MLPHPTPRMGLLRIPAPNATQVQIRLAPLADRDIFDPTTWRHESLSRSTSFADWWEIDLDALHLADSPWEYEFVVHYPSPRDPIIVSDPWAEEITRFGGYRGVLHVVDGVCVRPTFRWDDEISVGKELAENNKIVIYEMPVKWMSSRDDLDLANRQVDLGTFDEVCFEHLNKIVALGINAIELLPVQDSPDTLNWGYGTRFFFSPDFDMGGPVDLKYFIKRCHQNGIRVILDVVMNHSRNCPLEQLAFDWYNIQMENGRSDWGGKLMLFSKPAPGGFFASREFHYEMAEFWIREYRVDGFRIDEFKSINHWEFVQTFREKAWAAHNKYFPKRPFIVIAEDSNRRFEITRDDYSRPLKRKIVDAIWNFSYRDESRLLATNRILTKIDKPSRSERIRALISGSPMWDPLDEGGFREGLGDLAQAVNYFTSHDVQNSQRLLNFIFGALLQIRGLGDGSVDNIRGLLANMAGQSPRIREAHAEALDRIRSMFVLLLTSVGIPMFLAGEEFADAHDLPFASDEKMSDPVNWGRRDIPSHNQLWEQVADLIALRTSHSALMRNEVDAYYFHPSTDQDTGARVVAYARTNGLAKGASNQVVVIGNCGSDNFETYDFPWLWGGKPYRERGVPSSGSPAQLLGSQNWLRVSLAPFQFRVFEIR